jgi:hypothetical protein
MPRVMAKALKFLKLACNKAIENCNVALSEPGMVVVDVL